MRLNTAAKTLAAAIVAAFGCDPSGGSESPDGSGGASAGGQGGDGVVIEGGGGANETPPPPAKGNLTGVVRAPEGTIPISGALVYLTQSQPPAIPDGVYCDACEELTSSTPHTLSEANGFFDLRTHLTGELFLVVQKGQFRRVRKVTVNEGSQTMAAAVTTLPARMDKANGDDVPRMALIEGQWDHIENSLAKLGLADVTSGLLGPEVDTATAAFDFIVPAAREGLLSNWDQIKNYHVVFIPCSGSSGTTCNDSLPSSPQVQENLRKFVRAGGKLYATDYSYEFVRQPWPQLITFNSANGSIGSGCLSFDYNAPATVNDTGMHDWLEALGQLPFEVEANYTMVDALNSGPVLDLDGNSINATPKNWVSGAWQGGNHPATVSFQDQCGRVMFSTYHTEGAAGDSTLLAQELALLYVLLEVGVCVTEPIPT
jgi:hypothetical protein